MIWDLIISMCLTRVMEKESDYHCTYFATFRSVKIVEAILSKEHAVQGWVSLVRTSLPKLMIIQKEGLLKKNCLEKSSTPYL